LSLEQRQQKENEVLSARESEKWNKLEEEYGSVFDDFVRQKMRSLGMNDRCLFVSNHFPKDTKEELLWSEESGLHMKWLKRFIEQYKEDYLGGSA